MIKVNNVIGSRVRERRHQLGLTMRAVHERTGLALGFLSDLENGKRGVSAENLLTLARVLAVTPNWFYRPLLKGKDR